jgi:hypothetical protein
VTARLTATEALLAQAAAQTPAEAQAARLALIATGAAMMRPLDTTVLVAGDGSAGRELLASAPRGDLVPQWPIARRSRLLTARAAALAVSA